MFEAKAWSTFIRVCSLFRCERLNVNIRLILHKAIIILVMSQAFSDWEFAEDTHLLKLQILQNKVLRTIHKFPSCTKVRKCTWLSNYSIFMLA